MQILGERGAMQVNTKRIDIKGRTNSTIEPVLVHAIQEELAAFARVIHGELSRSTPEQALQDVAVIQAILESAETGRAVKPERIV
jgi:predicted dehydrogenase